MSRRDSQWDEYITLGAKVYPLEPGNYNIAEGLTPKPAGVLRLACLGDSATIGDRVRPDQPYPKCSAGCWRPATRTGASRCGT
jgi:hypothetical protein